MGGSGLVFGVLGPLEVRRGTDPVHLPAGKLRVLLASLLLHANRVVSMDQLVDHLWGDDPPDRARNVTQAYVMRLRNALGDAAVIRTTPDGYRIEIHPDSLDLHRFQELVDQGRKAADSANDDAVDDDAAVVAADLLRQALSLWRGPALADVRSPSLHRTEVPRLIEYRLQAQQWRIDADLRLGRHHQLIPELTNLTREFPLREQFWAQLILALYRADRLAEALRTYQDLRQTLADELGTDPSQPLQRLHQRVLGNDPTLDLGDPVSAGSAPAGSAPAGRPPARPFQLPADASSFTGRTAELAALDELVTTAPDRPPTVIVSAIAGAPGVGKTALAVRWAHLVAGRFPDGQLYVNLRGHATSPPLRPIDALARFLRALGVAADQTPVEEDEAAALYRSTLAGTRTLVVLDNAVDADQVRPLLPASPTCLTVVTSRDRLTGLVALDGAHRVTLGVLPAADAVDLLHRLIGADRVRAEPNAGPEILTEMARQCGYLPLALRIAAANLADRPYESIAGYTAGLAEGRLAALAVDGDGQAAVRAAFDLSYAALPGPARRLFRLLGLVPGPDIAIPAAAALAGTTVAEAGTLLDRLAGAHLLEHHSPGRYACHDLLRLYAVERVRAEDSEPDRAAAAGRLYDHYLAAADAAAKVLYPQMLRLPKAETTEEPTTRTADPDEASTWLEAERANLVAVVRHTAEQGPWPVAWRLSDTLRMYFYLRMYPIDWLAVATAGLAAATADNDPRAQAAAHHSLALLYGRQSRFDQAIQHYDQAIDLARRAGWPDGEATAHNNLGIVYANTGRPRQAADHYARTLVIKRRADHASGEAAALGNLGALSAELGRLPEAVEHSTQALALYRKIGNRIGEAHVHTGLGAIEHALGHLDQAADTLDQAVSLHRDVGNRINEVEARCYLAAVLRDAGRLAEARTHADAALTLVLDVGHRRLEGHARNALGTLEAVEGAHAAAAELHRYAIDVATATTDQYLLVEALLDLSRVVDRDKALGYAQRALTVASQAGYRVLEGHAHIALAGIHLGGAGPDRAVAHARQALDLHRDTGHRLGQARALVVLGRCSAVEVDADGHDHWTEALEIFTACGAAPEAHATKQLLAGL
jgi:DNA-binding SARP family transcriptional activator/tetratricopeptide (TPR) repeat protein